MLTLYPLPNVAYCMKMSTIELHNISHCLTQCITVSTMLALYNETMQNMLDLYIIAM